MMAPTMGSWIQDILHGKAEIGAEPGPQSILTAAEETKLVEYVVHMSYGQTKELILETVKSIIVKDGHPNTFKGGKPGRKWWRLFRKCHPELSLRKSTASSTSQINSFVVNYNFAMVAVCLIDQCSVIFQKKK